MRELSRSLQCGRDRAQQADHAPVAADAGGSQGRLRESDARWSSPRVPGLRKPHARSLIIASAARGSSEARQGGPEAPHASGRWSRSTRTRAPRPRSTRMRRPARAPRCSRASVSGDVSRPPTDRHADARGERRTWFIEGRSPSMTSRDPYGRGRECVKKYSR
jgi:hypothetical protein